MPTGKYAAQTTVFIEKSRNEIESTLARYGASKFTYMWDGTRAVIAFSFKNRNIRFVVDVPNPSDFSRTLAGRTRTKLQAKGAYQQTKKQKWRALALGVKAKLEMVESGISTFDVEFLPYMVLPGNRTVAEEVLPVIETMYETGKSIPLLTE